MVGDGLPQPEVASWFGVHRAAHGAGAELAAQEAAPGLVGEASGVGEAAGEVELDRGEGVGLGSGLPPVLRPQPDRGGGRLGRHRLGGTEAPAADEGPRPDAGGDVAIAGEPVVSGGDGGSRDPQACGQLPGGRQGIAFAQLPADDRLNQMPVQRVGQATSIAEVELQRNGHPDLPGLDWSTSPGIGASDSPITIRSVPHGAVIGPLCRVSAHDHPSLRLERNIQEREPWSWQP